MKKRIAVCFGGRSPEHDVSVITGLQVLEAVDATKYDAFPVYISADGKWYVGDVLRERNNYFLDHENLKKVTQVTLDITAGAEGRFVALEKGGMFSKTKSFAFDVALLAFHGLTGENGCIASLFETAGIAYTGMRPMASQILMDKIATKNILSSTAIPMLPYAVLKRPAQGYNIEKDVIKAALGNIAFPCILKPAHLGSSIGIAKVKNIEEIQECLPAVFEYDTHAVLEPFVENLVEYNVAVARIDGIVRTSCIERPKATDELLDFATKYKGGGSKKTGGVKSVQSSEGMLSLTRELNPELPEESEKNIRNWAETMFRTVNGTGAPRIDFIGNSKTGELWLNEVNPTPGSFGYFLWEASKDNSILFTELLTHLITEAQEERKKQVLPADPVPKDAQLLKRHL